jgi:hypothetical protein
MYYFFLTVIELVTNKHELLITVVITNIRVHVLHVQSMRLHSAQVTWPVRRLAAWPALRRPRARHPLQQLAVHGSTRPVHSASWRPPISVVGSTRCAEHLASPRAVQLQLMMAETAKVSHAVDPYCRFSAPYTWCVIAAVKCGLPVTPKSYCVGETV